MRLSKSCSERPEISWNPSLHHTMPPVSGWKITMGNGALSMVSLVAESTLDVTLSIYLRMLAFRLTALRWAYTASTAMITPSMTPITRSKDAATTAKQISTKKKNCDPGPIRRDIFLFTDPTSVNAAQ